MRAVTAANAFSFALGFELKSKDYSFAPRNLAVGAEGDGSTVIPQVTVRLSEWLLVWGGEYTTALFFPGSVLLK